MLTLRNVVQAWNKADPWRIHPTREHESEEAYWESGVLQAEQLAAHIVSGGTVIDFGCGDGRLSIPLAKAGFDVLAVDASEAMLERLTFNTQLAGVTIRTRLSDGLDLKVEPVDAILARAVLIHHSHADVTRLVTALSKLILPGGLFIADWPVGPHHERIDWIDVTTWESEHRLVVAEAAGLTLVEDSKTSVWRKL